MNSVDKTKTYMCKSKEGAVANFVFTSFTHSIRASQD